MALLPYSWNCYKINLDGTAGKAVLSVLGVCTMPVVTSSLTPPYIAQTDQLYYRAALGTPIYYGRG